MSIDYLKGLLGDDFKEDMTAEEIASALEAKKVNTEEEHSKHYKGLISKANSEAADWKKKYQGKLDEEEKKALDLDEAQKATDQKISDLEAKNKELERSIAISDQTGKLIAMGYTQELASDTATAMVDGDMDKVLKNQSTFVESVKQSAIAGKMRETPKPGAGASGGEGEKPDYKKLAAEAQQNGELATAAYYTRLAEEASKEESEIQ